MDFLDQARRWAVEATGLHHPSPTHRAPESPVYSPRIASPGLPRNLGEAVSRAVAAEARAASLQSALDRYVTQSEIMEVCKLKLSFVFLLRCPFSAHISH